MKKMTQITLALILASSTFAMECVGSKTFRDNLGNSQRKEVMLEKAFDYSDDKIHADIEEAYFVFNKYDQENYVAKITFGPDYTKGIASTATFDMNNRFELASVNGGTVYKLVCRK
ncbi:hypothetical protein [Halobacteriovorax sp. Y22]|uniref:hypothetical protein n=1 Tax=Halobacteriovorax sp. Y22 TaxID=2505978 RepID=UPI00108159F2|nr:hypothetical protein [Halobacteriovorax sp. Y22]TGD47959.1 hypothetical protein EP118_05875 [Halobacteriovorax sp. Y22]